MPDTNDYPNLWKRGLIQPRVRERANHRCEECGMEFIEGSNIAKDVKRSDGLPMVGTVHHIDMNKQNCSMKNLVYLCQSCHYSIHTNGDWIPGKHLPKHWRGIPPAWILERDLVYLTSGEQLVMWGDL